MFNNFVMKKMLKKQMKGMPEDQQEQVMKMIDNNPELIKQIAQEMQGEIKKGKDQQSAAMEVMQKHQEEIQRAMQQ